MSSDTIEDRIDRLEFLGVFTLSIITIGLLAAGSLLPLWTERDLDSSASESYSVVRIPFSSELWGGEEWPTAVGFGGLLLCTVIAIGLCMVTWARDGDRRTVQIARVIFRLMAVGALVPLVLTLNATDHPQDDVGPAILYYLAGIVVFRVLMLSGLRQVWLGDDERLRLLERQPSSRD